MKTWKPFRYLRFYQKPNTFVFSTRATIDHPLPPNYENKYGTLEIAFSGLNEIFFSKQLSSLVRIRIGNLRSSDGRLERANKRVSTGVMFISLSPHAARALRQKPQCAPQ